MMGHLLDATAESAPQGSPESAQQNPESSQRSSDSAPELATMNVSMEADLQAEPVSAEPVSAEPVSAEPVSTEPVSAVSNNSSFMQLLVNPPAEAAGAGVDRYPLESLANAVTDVTGIF